MKHSDSFLWWGYTFAQMVEWKELREQLLQQQKALEDVNSLLKRADESLE